MSDFVNQPLDEMMNARSVTGIIKTLENQKLDDSAQVENLAQIVTDLGDQVAGRFISPTTEDAVPTSVGFTGSFMSGQGEVFGSDTVQVGGVAAGTLQWGGTNNGKLIAGGGNVQIDANGIELTSGADVTVNQWMGLGLPSDGTSNVVYAIAYDSATNCAFVGGYFTKIGGIQANRIAKYNFSTKEWSSIGGSLNNEVQALVVDGDNLFVGGPFTSPYSYIAKYSISGDTWSSIGGSLNNAVRTLVVDGDNLFVGGSFTSPYTRIAKYSISGDTWSSIGGSFDSTVKALVVDGDNLFVGGSFTSPYSYIAKYSISGDTWSSIGGDLGSEVNALAVAEGNLFVGGSLTSPYTYILAKYSIVGDTWSFIEEGWDNRITSFVIDGDDLFIGGWFTSPYSYIARYSISSGVLSSIGGSLNNVVRTLAAKNSSLLVGGDFDYISGTSSRAIGIYIKALDEALNMLNLFSVQIRSDGTILGLAQTWNPMAIQASPNAYDDEFADASGGIPAGWTEFDPNSVLTVAENTNGLLFTQTTRTGQNNVGIYKALPGGDFSIITRMGLPGIEASGWYGGIALWEDATNTTKKLLTTYVNSSGIRVLSAGAYEWTNSTTASVSKVSLTQVNASSGTGLFMRLRRNGTNYYLDYSMDGYVWRSVNAADTAFTLSFTPTHMGLHTNNAATGTTKYAIADFFRRVGSDVTLIGRLDGRRV